MSLHLEDLIIDMVRLLAAQNDFSLAHWEMTFFERMAKHARDDQPLSTTQASIALKLLYKHRYEIATISPDLAAQIDALGPRPRTRRPLVVPPEIPREVRYIGKNLLAFRFKHDPVVISAFRDLSHTAFWRRPYFHQKLRVWIVEVNNYSHEAICSLIDRHRFKADEVTKKWLAECAATGPSTVRLGPGDIATIDVRRNALLARMIEMMVIEDDVNFSPVESCDV